MRSYSSGVRPCRSRTCRNRSSVARDASCDAAALAPDRMRLHDRFEDEGRRRCRAASRTRAPDAASGRPRCAPRCRRRRCVERSVRIGRVADLAGRVVYRNTIWRLASSSLDHIRRREVVPLAVRDRHAAAPGPARTRVNGVSVCSTRMWHVLAAKLQPCSAASRRAGDPPPAGSGSRCRCRAPGRRARRTPAPRAMIGEKRAIAPVRR